MRPVHAALPIPRRRGVALLLALLAVLIIGTLIGTTSWQIMANRRLARMRQHELQAAWLARAGVELACARLLGDPAHYTGETLEPIPNSRLRIQVKNQNNSPHLFEIVSESRYPVDHSEEMRRSLTCRVRREVNAGKTCIEIDSPVMPSED